MPLKNKILFFLLLIAGLANAQQVYVGAGFGSAVFKNYADSSGENTLDYSGFTQSKEPLFDAGFRFNLYKERIKFDIGTNYNKYKINTSFYSGNTTIPITYNLSYISAKAGFNISLIRWKRIKLQVHLHYSYDWLTYGTYRYTDVRNRDIFVDIYKEKTLDRTLFRYHRGLGIEYKVSEKISAYCNYDLGTSFREENKDSRNGERYALDTQAITLGLLFELSKKNKY